MFSKVADTTEAHLGRTDRFFIGRHWVPPSSEASIDVIVPATEEIYQRFAAEQQADVERAVVAAHKAFVEGPWAAMLHAERAVYL